MPFIDGYSVLVRGCLIQVAPPSGEALTQMESTMGVIITEQELETKFKRKGHTNN